MYRVGRDDRHSTARSFVHVYVDEYDTQIRDERLRKFSFKKCNHLLGWQESNFGFLV